MPKARKASMSSQCRWRRGLRCRWATSSATSTTPKPCRWKSVLTPKPSITRVRARPPITGKPQKRSSKSASPPFRVIENGRLYEAAADLPGGAAARARDLGYSRDHGAQRVLPRRQRRQIRPRECAAAGRYHFAGSGGAVPARHGGRALSRKERWPPRLYGDLLLRRSRRTRQARQCDG